MFAAGSVLALVKGERESVSLGKLAVEDYVLGKKKESAGMSRRKPQKGYYLVITADKRRYFTNA